LASKNVVSAPHGLWAGAIALSSQFYQLSKDSMKTVFDQSTREELIQRVSRLTEASIAQWGKMNVSQMMRHCAQWDEMALGKTKYKQSLLGKLFGKMALKNMMKEEPVKRNLPTVPSFVIKEQVDFDTEKAKWIRLLNEYNDYPADSFIHPFFGPLSKAQTGLIVYKHIDHHLRQFSC
jgi:hypothetical protein